MSAPPVGARSPLLGAALVVGSALCFAIMPVFAKVAYREAVSPLGLLAWRFVGAAAVLWAIVWWRSRRGNHRLPTRRQSLNLLLLGGVLLAGEVALYFFGLQHLSAGLAEVLLFLFPAWVVIIVAITQRSWPGALVITCTALAVAGAGLAVQGGVVGLPGDVLFGASLLVGASLTFAIYIVLSGRAAAHVGPLATTTLVISGAAVTFVIATVLTGAAGPSTPLGFAMSGAIALVSTVMSFGLLTAGLSVLPATHVSVIATSEPVFAVMLGWQLLGEAIAPGQLVGIALVIGSIAVILARDVASAAKTPATLDAAASMINTPPGANRE